MLQAALGNHRRALQHFELRSHLPFVEPRAELAFQLARARSALYASRLPEALGAAARAVELTRGNASLAAFRPLALDRLAFSQLASGEPRAAAEHYDLLEPLLQGPGAAPIDRLKAALGASSAKLAAGDAASALAAAERARTLLLKHPDLAARGPSSWVERYVYDRAHYLALVDGLRAEALIALRRLPEAGAALAKRAEQLSAFFAQADTDDALLALAQLQLRQAEVERTRGRTLTAATLAEQGLARIAEFNRRTGSGATDTGLRLLRVYAELTLFAGVPRDALKRDLNAELDAAYAFITRYPSPRWKQERARFELYLTLLRARSSQSTARASVR
jgi:hypothetical protein